ncbi:MAG TPA: DUF397 domain-containing protein [Streptomyces sp.]|jgi:hypothetical protein|nr:DUF397 domain-containing protein [Streptomyces sp.]
MNAQQDKASSGDLRWFKSSYSGSDGGDCVEVAASPGTVHLRDSKSARGPVLCVPQRQWAAFVSYAIN